MTVLSAGQLADLAYEAGWWGTDTGVAIAVAIGESGGKTDQVTRDADDESYGIWQINMRGTLGPARRREYGLPSNDALLDPKTNARVAHAIWAKDGWRAWGAYTNGSYLLHMPAAVAAVAARPRQAFTTAVDGVGDAVAQSGPVRDAQVVAGAGLSAAQGAGRLLGWLAEPGSWVRILKVAVGGALIVAGVSALARPGLSAVPLVGGKVKMATKFMGG